METAIVIVFILGYLAITLEHTLKIDKLVPALLMMAIVWACIALGLGDLTSWFDSDKHAMVEGFKNFDLHSTHGSPSKMQLFEGFLLHHFGKTC